MDSEIIFHLVHTFGIPKDIATAYVGQMMAQHGLQEPQSSETVTLEQMRKIVANYLLDTLVDQTENAHPN